MRHDILLSAQGITKSFPDGEGASRVVLNALNLEVRRHSLVVIRGESGCGKSTLLRILGLVDPEFEGSLEICGEHVGGDGQPLTATAVEEFRARHIGFVFQDDLLLPLLNLRENSELPARIHRMSEEAIKDRLEELQSLIFRPDERTDGVLDRHRTTVSGGQRQRAAILRAFSHGPNLILADEPTANLDPVAKKEVVELFRRLCQRGHTVVVASHDAVFSNVGETYAVSDGKLRRMPSKSAPLDVSVPQRRNVYRSSRLRGCPPGLQAKIALREALGNPLFAVMIIAAMAAGLFQLTLLWSVRQGTENVLDEVINKGSRLDRIVVAARAQVEDPAASALPSAEFLKTLGDPLTVPRREILIRIDDARGRERQETAFGLVPGDPEVKKLELREGQAFANQDSLSVLITERSVERLFGTAAVGQPATGRELSLRFRRYVAPDDGTSATLSLATEEALQMEEKEFTFVVRGVLDRAEAGRNLYLPQETLLAIAAWQMDPTARLEASDGRLELTPESAKEQLAWERLHVYFDKLEEVLPAAANFERQGFSTKADLFRYRWILDTRRFVSYMLGGITGMVMGIAGLLLMSNVVSGVRLKRKEIAVLKLMGMKNRDVVSIFVLSVLLCALLGGLLGFGLGSLTVDQISAYLAAAYPDSPLGQVWTPTWQYVGGALLLTVVVTFIFTVWPAWRTASKEAVWKLD